MRYLYFESVEGDLLEALFYAPEVNSPSSRARSVGFCALRPGAECATPVDRVLCPREPSALRQGAGGCCATVGRPMLQLGGGGF